VDLSYWHSVRRSDLVRLRVAVRKGWIEADTLQGILVVLRKVRSRPDTKPYLARSLDAFFRDLRIYAGSV
jgi:hypothetical protein